MFRQISHLRPSQRWKVRNETARSVLNLALLLNLDLADTTSFNDMSNKQYFKYIKMRLGNLRRASTVLDKLLDYEKLEKSG